MAFDHRDVEKLADLARLALTPQQVAATASQLDRLLAYVDQLQDIDVEGASETVHVGDRATPMRPDTCRPGLAPEAATAGAPQAADDLFWVPKVIDDDAGEADA